MTLSADRPRLARRGALMGFGLLALAGCGGQPAPMLNSSEQSTIAQVQDYLDGLRQFHAPFTQTGTDGAAQGMVWLARPGRLRVEYQTPRPKLLLANHGRLLLADQTTGATTNLPVASTPLQILLADKIVLSGAVTVTSVQAPPGVAQISLIKTGAPGKGLLTLQFSTGPLTLTSVTVQDSAGHNNTLHLGGLVADGAADDALFQYHPPADAGN